MRDDGFAPAVYSIDWRDRRRDSRRAGHRSPRAREIEALRARRWRSGCRSSIIRAGRPSGWATSLAAVRCVCARPVQAEMDLRGATLGTARNGTYVPERLETRRGVLAGRRSLCRGGTRRRDRGRHERPRAHPGRFIRPRRSTWSSEVADYWESQGVKATVFTAATCALRVGSPRVSSAPGGPRFSASAATATSSDSRPDLGAVGCTQVGPPLGALGGGRLLVAGQRRTERHARLRHDQRRAGRRRRTAAGRPRDRLLLAARPDREVDQGDALAHAQRRRADRTRDPACSRSASGRAVMELDRAAEQADRPYRLSAVRRLIDGVGAGCATTKRRVPRARCTRWRFPARTPLRRAVG